MISAVVTQRSGRDGRLAEPDLELDGLAVGDTEREGLTFADSGWSDNYRVDRYRCLLYCEYVPTWELSSRASIHHPALRFMSDIVVRGNMADSTQTDSPLEAVVGVAGPEATEAFELLSNETRLAILLALWEAYEPHENSNAISFSELRERVGVRDSGQFNYHLGKLDDRYIEETKDGYELNNSGLNIVQAVIAGTGLGETSLPRTEIDVACERCGAPTEIHYEDGFLYQTCTECQGHVGPQYTGDLPDGTLAVREVKPAGLADRTPGEVFATGHIDLVASLASYARGVCPTCSGAVEETVDICETHELDETGFCPECGTTDEVRIHYRCSVCKAAGTFPVEAVTNDLPVVDAFCFEEGIDLLEDVTDPESAARVYAHHRERDHQLISSDPVRIGITVPGEDSVLQLTLDEELEMINVTQEETI